MSMREERRWLSIKWIPSTEALGVHAGCAYHSPVAILVPHLVHGLVEVDDLVIIVEEVYLVASVHDMAKLDAN